MDVQQPKRYSYDLGKKIKLVSRHDDRSPPHLAFVRDGQSDLTLQCEGGHLSALILPRVPDVHCNTMQCFVIYIKYPIYAGKSGGLWIVDTCH